jgi:hypothetical protein
LVVGEEENEGRGGKGLAFLDKAGWFFEFCWLEEWKTLFLRLSLVLLKAYETSMFNSL